jgi:hypothetical protein
VALAEGLQNCPAPRDPKAGTIVDRHLTSPAPKVQGYQGQSPWLVRHLRTRSPRAFWHATALSRGRGRPHPCCRGGCLIQLGIRIVTPAVPLTCRAARLIMIAAGIREVIR